MSKTKKKKKLAPITTQVESAPLVAVAQMPLPCEYLHTELYDREKLIVPEPTYDASDHVMRICAPKKVTLFAQPLGMRGKGLTKTNMVQCGQLPAPNTMEVETVSLCLLEDGAPISRCCPLWWNSNFELLVYGKNFLTTLAHVFRKGPIRLLRPIKIGEQQNFSATFETQWIYDPRRNFEVICYLTGILKRSVF